MDKCQALTGQVRHRCQFLGPKLRDLDGLVLHGLTFGRMALLVGVAEQFTDVFRLERVQDVEEVISWRAFVGRIMVREVTHDDRVLLELWIDVLDGELVVPRHLDGEHIHLLEQLFLPRQHRLQEIFVDHLLVREVVLQAGRI